MCFVNCHESQAVVTVTKLIRSHSSLARKRHNCHAHVYLTYLTCISRVSRALLITKIILVVIITILLKIIPQQHFHRSWKSGIIEIIFLIAFEGGFCLAGKLNTALIICSTNSEAYLLDSDIFSMLFLFVSVHAPLVWGCSD